MKTALAILLAFGFCFGFDENATLAVSNLSQNAQNIELSFYSLYSNADMVVKCVIYILVFFSVLTWSVFICKFIEYFLAFRALKGDENSVRNLSNLNDLSKFKKQSFAKRLIKEINLETSACASYNANAQNRIKERLEIEILKIFSSLKSYVWLLASIGSSSPFIGLFGTVWGIMNSFIGIANANNASLNIIAPGIAEALFATAFGLMAAIPAVLFYNYFIQKNAKFSNKLNELATTIYILSDRLNEAKNADKTR